MKKLLLVCCFIVGISAVSRAQGRQRMTPDQQVAQLKTQLTGLTDDQATKLTAIFTTQSKSMDSLRTAANGDFSSMREKMQPMQAATAAKVKAVLTPEQATAYQKIQDERRARMQQGGN
jgi:protein CpxP